MTLDRRHMAGSLAVLGCAIAYNVWVFTRPVARAGVEEMPATVGAPSPAAAGDSGVTALDPAQVPALADVSTDRLPTWPRDPFENLKQLPLVLEPVPTIAAPVEEPDPVVASILYSPGRRLAVIDGRIVRPGDRAGRAKVIDILPKAVVLEHPDGDRRVVELRGPAVKEDRR
jgi:hypothetical protein